MIKVFTKIEARDWVWYLCFQNKQECYVESNIGYNFLNAAEYLNSE